MYALFDGPKQIGQPFPTEMEVWEHAVKEGLVEISLLRMKRAAGSCPGDTTSRR
jgi:hypothetical protein